MSSSAEETSIDPVNSSATCIYNDMRLIRKTLSAPLLGHRGCVTVISCSLGCCSREIRLIQTNACERSCGKGTCNTSKKGSRLGAPCIVCELRQLARESLVGGGISVNSFCASSFNSVHAWVNLAAILAGFLLSLLLHSSRSSSCHEGIDKLSWSRPLSPMFTTSNVQREETA